MASTLPPPIPSHHEYVALAEEDEDVTPYESNSLEIQLFCRHMVRLLQCEVCDRPFQRPVTLACGHSFCKDCLAVSSYPVPRLESLSSWKPRSLFDGRDTKTYRCRYPSCHKVSTCSAAPNKVDILLANVVSSFADVIKAHPPSTALTASRGVCPEKECVYLFDTPRTSDGGDRVHHELISCVKEMAKYSNGGAVSFCDRVELAPGDTRLGSIFQLASKGHLTSRMETYFYSPHPMSPGMLSLNYEVDRAIRGSITSELTCYVCCALLYRPATALCGHSFCRECLQRSLDYQHPCPVCRCPLNIRGALERYEINLHLNSILTHLFPRETERRAQELEDEYHSGQVPDEIPLFMCAITFPSCPSYLHIIEPRYRLMMRRTYNGNRRFGMVNLARSHDCQFGEDTSAQEGCPVSKSQTGKQYMEYGTILEIRDRGWLIDGRSYIESLGMSKIRITRTREHDGYLMATYEKADDLPEDVEAEIEMRELDSPEALNLTDHDGYGSLSFQAELVETFGVEYWYNLNHMSSERMAMRIVDFIQDWHSRRPLHLLRSHRFAFGRVPASEPNLLPYWLFHAIYASQDDLYRVLRSRSVRERLKLAVLKIDLIQANNGYVFSPCRGPFCFASFGAVDVNANGSGFNHCSHGCRKYRTRSGRFWVSFA